MRAAWVIMVAALGCGGDPQATPFDAIPRVVLAEVRAPVPGTRRLVSVAEPLRDVSLVPLRGGRVVERPHEPGAEVSEGALLLRLDAREARARMLSAQAGLREAEAALADARRQLERVEALGDGASGAQVDVGRLAVERGEAAVDRARAQRDLARVDADEMRLRAPFAGVLTALEPEVGAVVGAGAPVGRLVDASSLRVRVSLLADEIGQVGDASFIVIGSGGEAPARLRWVSPAADPRTGGWAVELGVDASPAIPAGSAVDVRVLLPPVASDAEVPREAVDEGGVWLVEGEDELRVRRAAVEVVSTSAVGLRVRGVEPGARVVLRAAEPLSDGARVVALEARP